MPTNPDNWEAYLTGFRTHFSSLTSTDPNRFPTDDRDGNGFWMIYTVSFVYAKFTCNFHTTCSCRHADGHVWTSREVQIDIKVMMLL